MSKFVGPRSRIPEIHLHGSSRVNLPFDPAFLQQMVSRLVVGEHRYGANNAGQDYLRRARRALEHYAKTGNIEFLVDAANYALLEAHYPLHPNAHYEVSDSNGRRQ